jgi:hypothetical protein
MSEATPAWFYRKGEAQIFEDGVCPEGWQDTPVEDDDEAAEAEKPKRGRKPKAEAEESGSGE